MIMIPTSNIENSVTFAEPPWSTQGEREQRIDKSRRERAQCVEQRPVAREPEHEPRGIGDRAELHHHESHGENDPGQRHHARSRGREQRLRRGHRQTYGVA